MFLVSSSGEGEADWPLKRRMACVVTHPYVGCYRSSYPLLYIRTILELLVAYYIVSRRRYLRDALRN